MTPLLDASTSWQLTLALWHTCWFGMLAAGVAALGNRLLRKAPAWRRYWLSFAALASIGACLPVSFLLVRARNAEGTESPSIARALAATPIENVSSAPVESDNLARENDPVAPTGFRPSRDDEAAITERPAHLERVGAKTQAPLWNSRMHVAAPYVTALYLLGVIAMLGKLLVAIYGGKRLRAGSSPVAEPHLLELVARQSRRLALRFVPAVAFCERIAVPVVVGIVRPMILVPAGMLTGMAPDELAAILTHELAHIRSHDHWLILVQRCLEALLFFHPAAWYLSRRVHAERESCCDDLVVAAGGDRLVYAQSLLRVAELRLQSDSQQKQQLVALAADGRQPSQLRRRIARLLGDSSEPHVRFRNPWPAILLGLVCAAAFWGVVAGAWQAIAQIKEKDDESQTVVVVEWCAIVRDDVMDEIRALDDARNKQDAGTGVETIRCPANRLRSLIKERLKEKGQIGLGHHVEVIPPSPEGFRKSGIAHTLLASGLLTNPANAQLPISAAVTGAGSVFLEQRAAGARFRVDIKLGLLATNLRAKFDETIDDGRATAFAATADSCAGIVVYEALRIRADQAEMVKIIHRPDEWLKLGPAGIRTRLARADAWRAKAKESPVRDDPQWTRQLPNGGNVQVLGFSRPKAAPLVWWDPAGRPTAGPPPQAGVHVRDHDLVALVRIWETGSKRNQSVDGYSGHDNIIELPDPDPKRKGASPQLVVVPAKLTNGERVPSLEVGTGFGAWTSRGELKVEERATAMIGGASIEVFNLADFDVVNRTGAFFRWTSTHDDDLIVVAVSRAGNEVWPSSNPAVYFGGSSNGFSFQYPLRQADIDHFVVKTRPCHWAEFTGFAIEPAEPLQPPLDFSKPDDDEAATEKPRANVVADNDDAGARGAPAATDKDQADPLLPEILAQTAQRGTKNFDAIKTAHIKFRTSRGAGPYKAGLTPERCRKLLDKYDLVQHPDRLGELLIDLLDEDGHRPYSWWVDGELHVDGRKTREALEYVEQGPDVHITDGEISLRWDEANSQVNIDLAREDRRYQMSLRDFWRPLGAPAVDNVERTVRAGGVLTLFVAGRAGWKHEIAVDEATGFLLRLTSHNGNIGTLEQEHWLGWQPGTGGIPYPKVVVRLDYRGNQLSGTNFLVVDEMRLNIPIPDSVFRMGAPAGSGIFDRRQDAVIGGGRINHDVFDVTSREQLIEGAKPLDPEPRTPQEKFAVAELARIYALADDEVLKRIAPPYPVSRKHLPKLLGERYMSGRAAVHSYSVRWENGQPTNSWGFEGGSFPFQNLVTNLLKLKSTEIEGDPELLMREIPGDFVYRAGAPPERLAESLAEIAGLEFGRPVRLVSREVERPVYIVRGALKLALPEGQKIALNGGSHSGDHGEVLGSGKLEHLLDGIASYIHTPVVNEAEPSSAALSWSSRWYDLADTPAEKRFKLDPQVVLKQITDQTGITFTSENRTTRVLFVEMDDVQ